MNKLAVPVVLLILTPVFGSHAQGLEPSDPYVRQAPLEQYLASDRDGEIALARSAAPPAISGHARILVLGKQGYDAAVMGENGFTCLVERSWMSPFDNPEFWNPKIRGPVCYNPAATRSVLPYTLYRTELVLKGTTKTQLIRQIRAAVAAKRLSAPESGAMSYMMSKQGYLADSAGAWHSHLMFHVSKSVGPTWGANDPGSPVVVDSVHTQVPEPQTILMVPVGQWSDGTAAPLHDLDQSNP